MEPFPGKDREMTTLFDKRTSTSPRNMRSERVKYDSVATTIPTIGFNGETSEYKSL